MCAPVAIGLMAAGTAMQMYGSYRQGKSMEAYYNYLAQENEKEAVRVMGRAQDEKKLINYQQSQEQHKLVSDTSTLEGTQKATMAANGVYSTSVTAEDIARDTQNKKVMDEMAIRYNADTKMWETQKAAEDTAASLRSNASLNRMAGRQAFKSGQLGAWASLLGGAGQIGGSMMAWKKA